MDQIIEVQVKSVYGQDRIYPINDQAKRMTDLLGRKTLTSADISKIKDMGFKVVWTPITLDK